MGFGGICFVCGEQITDGQHGFCQSCREEQHASLERINKYGTGPEAAAKMWADRLAAKRAREATA